MTDERWTIRRCRGGNLLEGRQQAAHSIQVAGKQQATPSRTDIRPYPQREGKTPENGNRRSETRYEGNGSEADEGRLRARAWM